MRLSRTPHITISALLALIGLFLLVAAPAGFAQDDPTRLPAPAAGPGPGPGIEVVNGKDFSPPIPSCVVTGDNETLQPTLKTFDLQGNARIVGGSEFDIFANHIWGKMDLGTMDASGNVHIREFDTDIGADEVHLDSAKDVGSIVNGTIYRPPFLISAAQIAIDPTGMDATNATVTTSPPGSKPLYRIVARRIQLQQASHRITLRHASFYLGKTRLITIPKLTQQYQQNRPQGLTTFQQRFGYSSADGAYVGLAAGLPVFRATTLGLKTTVGTHAVRGTGISAVTTVIDQPHQKKLDKPTAKNVVATLRQLSEPTGLPVGLSDPLRFHDFVTSDPIGSTGSQPLKGPIVTAGIQAMYEDQLFGRITPNLFVTRLPEVDLSAAVPLGHRPDLPTIEDPVGLREALAHPDIVARVIAQDGFYKELPSHVSGDREALLGTLESRPMLIAPNTLLRPLVDFTTNAYPGTNLSFRYLQAGIGVEHDFTNKTAIGLTYTKSFEAGKSPFIFDTPDTANEIDLTGQYGTNKFIIGARIQCSLDSGSIYDYQISIGPNLGSIVPMLMYDNRSQDISLGFNISGINF